MDGLLFGSAFGPQGPQGPLLFDYGFTKSPKAVLIVTELEIAARFFINYRGTGLAGDERG